MRQDEGTPLGPSTLRAFYFPSVSLALTEITLEWLAVVLPSFGT